MPLTAKGKKLKKKFEEQYGKKKGQSVFYAMESSGKLKKVVKAASGREAGMGMAGKTGDYGGSKSGGNGRDPSAQFKGPKTTVSQAARDAMAAQRKTARETISPSTSTAGKVLKYGLMFSGIPFAGTITSKLMDRTPYWSRGKKTTKDTKPTRDGNGQQKTILPIVTPVQTTKPVDTSLISPKDNFFNFVAYKTGGLSGGVKYGPPPKRGPNPQGLKKGGYKK